MLGGFDFQSWRICMGKDRRFSFWASGPKRLHSHVWPVEGGQSKSRSNKPTSLPEEDEEEEEIHNNKTTALE